MAYTKYSLTPANNTATPPDGAPEGMLPSAVNDTMRDMMAQIRDCGDGIRDGTYTMTAPKITGGTITGAAFTGNTFTSPVITGGSINNTPIGASTANTGAFTTLSASGATTFSGAVVMSSTLSANGGATLGDASGDALTINSSAVSIPNGLNFDSNTFVIDAANNQVGIGTSSPASALQVLKASANPTLNITRTTSSATTIGDALYLRLNDTTGTSGMRNEIGMGYGIPATTTYTPSLIGYVQTSSSGSTFGDLYFATRSVTTDTAPSERMRIASSGNVVIGATDAQSRLTVNDASSSSTTVGTNPVIWIGGGNGSVNTNSEIGFTYGAASWAETYAPATIGYQLKSGSGYTYGDITFCTRSVTTDTAPTERMRIDSSGNVRIGSTTLEGSVTTGVVKYLVLSGGYASNPQQIGMTMLGGADGAVGHFTFSGQSSGGNPRLVASISGYQTGTTVSAAAGYLAFNTNVGTAEQPTERMRIDSSGNVGIGTSSPNKTGFTAPVLSVSNGTAGIVELIGNQTSDGTVGQIAWYNNSATSPDRVAQILGLRSGANNSGALTFQTTNAGSIAERMRIDSSGNVGIGTSSPSTKLTVAGDVLVTGGGVYYLRDTTTYTYSPSSGVMTFITNSAERMRIDSSGNVLFDKTAQNQTTKGFEIRAGGIGGIVAAAGSSTSNSDTTYHLYSTGATAYRFYVGYGGTIYATSTTISAISDARLKENIQDIDAGLDKVMALKPRKFDWKAGKGKDKKGDRGWIAQEFEQVFPEMIDTWKDPAPEGEEPYKSVNADLIPVLVKAIQEQQAMIEELKQEVAKLKGV